MANCALTVVPLLLRSIRVTSPNLQLDPVSREAPSIKAIVGPGQLDLAVPLLNLPELVGAKSRTLDVTRSAAKRRSGRVRCTPDRISFDQVDSHSQTDEGPIAGGSRGERETLGVVPIGVDQLGLGGRRVRSGRRRDRGRGRRRGSSRRTRSRGRRCRSDRLGSPSLTTSATTLIHWRALAFEQMRGKPRSYLQSWCQGHNHRVRIRLRLHRDRRYRL